MNETKHKRPIDATALLALAALTLIFFWKIALTNRVLAGLDLFAYFYPYRDYASEALRAGRLPLWNPYLFMGAPLLANSQVAVLYPLHWPLLWLSAPKQIAWSIVLHIWLAGAGTYLYSRRVLDLRPPAALVAAALFGLGGFLGAQVEHVNQLNASAWLPWLLLCLEGAWRAGRPRWLALLGGGAVVGLALLAGHTQAAYIVLLGAGVYALARGFGHLRARRWRPGLGRPGALAVMGLLGLLLAAGQLLPTLELSGRSVRSGGLPYHEAASFSLKPHLIFKAFLPPLLWEPPFSEYVAYVGLLGLALAALGTWAIVRRRRPGTEVLILALTGAFLAFGAYNPVYYLLYKILPGIALFRAPARWLLLYAFGAALLAGLGLEMVIDHDSARSTRVAGRKWAAPLLVLILLAELFLAGRKLAYNAPTAPAAFDSMRTAPAHLLADQVYNSELEPFRFLSMSDITYDPGDLADLQTLYAGQLSSDAIYDLVVATKMKEVLAFNLPLHYQIYSVDGYDGGLLPTAHYVDLERLFLAEDEIWSDGRLRQQLRRVPASRLLSLLNVKYVITDKLQDVWIDGVFYDLEFTTPLGCVQLADLPDFETSHLGLVSYLTGTLDVADGTPVATVTVTGRQGARIETTLRAGVHTAEGLYHPGATAHHQAQIGHRWRDNEAGSDYVAVLNLGQALRPVQITVRSLLPGEAVQLRGLTLIDGETGTGRTVSVAPAYRQVHSGDVKIYENLEVLPRAFVVHQARVIDDGRQAATLAALAHPAFDPGHEVILAGGEPLAGEGGPSSARFTAYQPERLALRVDLDRPGYLVLTDSHYPGWVAKVNGEPAPIFRADLYFRALALEAGQHEVVFRYRPAGTYAGLVVSLVTWLLWSTTVAVTALRIGRKQPSSV